MNNKELLVSILDPLIFHEMAYLGAKGGPSTLDITDLKQESPRPLGVG